MAEEETTYLVQAVMNLLCVMWATRRKTSDSMYQFIYEKRQNHNLYGIGLWLPPHLHLNPIRMLFYDMDCFYIARKQFGVKLPSSWMLFLHSSKCCSISK